MAAVTRSSKSLHKEKEKKRSLNSLHKKKAKKRSSNSLHKNKEKKRLSHSYLNHVEDYVLIEILKRLPTKLAHQCKSVSKRWLSAISSDYFIKRYYNFHHSHLDQSNPSFALICYQSNSNRFWIRDSNKGADCFKLDLLLFDMSSEFSHDTLAPPPQSPPYEMFTVLSSNNGLVLCATKPKAYATRYFVCNPLSKMCLPIPRAPTIDNKAQVGFLCQAPFFLVNDKNSSAGLENTSYSFRIVRLMEIDGIIKVEIYASETGKWTEHILIKTDDFSNFKHINHTTRSVTCDGLLYWQTLKALIVMDPYKCRIGAVKLPQFRHGHTQPCYFGECRGKVRGVQYHEESLTVWELEDYNINARKWSLVQEIDLVYKIPGISSIIFHPFNEDAWFLIVRGQIVLYDITKKITRVIWGTTNNYLITSFPIVLPWWTLSESPHKKSITANTFASRLMMSNLNSDYSSIPIDQDYPQSSSSDSSNESSSDSDSDTGSDSDFGSSDSDSSS